VSKLLSSVRRQLEFAAHVPPRQIFRRFWLTVQRRLDRLLKPRLGAGALQTEAELPLPLFPPRQASCSRQVGGWSFNFLGRTIEMTGPIAWRTPSGDPADRLWRMNLHYMEYLEDLSDDAAAEAMLQWIVDNPPYARGAEVDSWSAYTISLRAVVWMQQLAVRPSLPGEIRKAAEDSLIEQLHYLERHLETDVGGNHLIKNIKALIWASVYFRGDAARKWRRKGLPLLNRELGIQFPADGVHFELSPSYHCQALADLLEIRHGLGEDPLGGQLDDAIARAAVAAADLAHPDGRIAQFGDAGLSMAYAPERCLEAVRAIYGAAPAPRQRFSFLNAGYFGARDDGDFVIVDAGPIATERLPAHGHGDALSFEWSLGGWRVIVDQGVYEYVAGPRRRCSRAAASHNTVSVEGADQAEFFGAFRSARRARVRRLFYAQAEDGFTLEAEHDGFSRTGGGPVHRRRFTVTPRHIRIEDRLIGEWASCAQSSLLLSPEARAKSLGSGGVRIICGNSAILVTGSAPLTVRDAVWWPDMGIERHTLRLVMEIDPRASASWIELAAERIAVEAG
jgi:uncharacterized heparinase superfamily protein